MSKRDLIVNYTPGEECRVAVVNNGKLDEFYSERTDNVSHVGNIYVGRVTNIEPAISAAFVDFGLDANGFLHVSDLHPRYFPGEGKNTKERVGKKTPRRERPAINEALRKGQEVIVQVLKEGVGSKGPTLTSYLSIPGRYLVMMPGMDRTGVSRKVEDDGQRAKMKAILDQLDLPEEFGFILRTAGFDRTKAELKRDLAYLLRLEKEMEKRRKTGGKPRLLYSEGDLLIRALRDMLTTDTERVIVDNEDAVGRAARFMKIVSPRTVTKLYHYKGHTPVFHALGLHEQLQTVYSREVPLPSGGRLVIDETEALVAIDINSGKSRSAGDSEDNAFRTNMEAAEEICRQLRLRDLGGIVINDLIDMRQARHRKDVETHFEKLLSADRAKSTICPISEFGILEMTRQRMRGSHESLHFVSCPTCHGRGLVQKPESVAADAIRDMAALLDQPKVKRVELVVHPRVGSEMLSTKRRALVRLERQSGKTVAIRLSEALSPDRVTFYAYDESGNDLEIDRLPKFKLTDELLAPFTEPGLDEAIAAENAQDGFAEDVLAAAAAEDLADDRAVPAFKHAIETELAPEDLALVREKPVRPPVAPLPPGPPRAPIADGLDEGMGRGGRRGRRGGRGRGAKDRAGFPPNEPVGTGPAHPVVPPFTAGPDLGDGPAPVPMYFDVDGNPVVAAPQPPSAPRQVTPPPLPIEGEFGPDDNGPFPDGQSGDGAGERGGRRRRRRRRGGRGGERGPDGQDFAPQMGQPGAVGPNSGVRPPGAGALNPPAFNPPAFNPPAFNSPGSTPAGPIGPQNMSPAPSHMPPPLPRPPMQRPPQGGGGQSGYGGQNQPQRFQPAPSVPRGGSRPQGAPPANSLAARFRSESAPSPGAGGPSPVQSVGPTGGGVTPPPLPREGGGFSQGPEGDFNDHQDQEGGRGPDQFSDQPGAESPAGQGRRRRRRRGRGRGNGTGPGGFPTGEGFDRPPSNDRGVTGPGPGVAPAAASPAPVPRPMPRPMPLPNPPAPPPAGGIPPGAKPRGLYSSFRKLKPGEKGAIKRED